MTAAIGRQAALVALPDTEIVPLTPLLGAESVEGNNENYFAAIAITETAASTAQFLGRPYSVVTSVDRTVPLIHDRLRLAGLLAAA